MATWPGTPTRTNSAKRAGCWPANRSNGCTRGHWMTWEVVIGLETHAQLTTARRSSPARRPRSAPRRTRRRRGRPRAPGVLPVLNRGAVERAIRFGLAIGGDDRAAAASSRARTTSIPTCRRATRSASTRSRSSRAAPSTFVVQPRTASRHEDGASHARPPRGGRRQVAARRTSRTA